MAVHEVSDEEWAALVEVVGFLCAGLHSMLEERGRRAEADGNWERAESTRNNLETLRTTFDRWKASREKPPELPEDGASGGG